MFETIVTVIKKKIQKLETEGQEFKKKKKSHSKSEQFLKQNTMNMLFR